MQVQLYHDTKKYDHKPEDLPAIRYRLANSSPQDVSLFDVKTLIEGGVTIMPAVVKPTVNDNGNLTHKSRDFENQRLFGVDIDNSHESEPMIDADGNPVLKENGKPKKRKLTPDEGYITPAQALEICQAYGIKPFLMYHTFSSTPDFEKFRIFTVLDELVTDDKERERIVSTFISLFGRAADIACTDAVRVFHGSRPDCTIHFDQNAATPKSVFLNIWDQMQEKNASENAESNTFSIDYSALTSSSTPMTNTAAYEQAKDPRFDADPVKLLFMIDPNSLSYKEWVKITGAFINSGGSRSDWDAWCSRYADNSPKQNEKVWKTCGKAGSHGKATIGTLKRRAHEHNPAAYDAYKDELTQAQRAARKAEKQKSKPTPTPQDSTSDAAPEFKLPSWIVPTKDGTTLRISPVRLEKEIRGKFKIIYTKSGDVSGKSVFVYIPSKGFYKYADTKSFATMIKAMVDKFNEKSPVLLDNYRKARDEAIEYLNTYVPKDTYRPEDLDSEEDLMNCENGMVNLKTGEILKHSPKYRSTRQLPVKYDPSKHYTLDDAPRFAKYLDDLTAGDPDRKQLLLEYAGAVFSSVDGSRYKRILYLVGAGDSGKSQYVKLIAQIVGEDFSAPAKFNTLDDRFQKAVLVGMRFVFDADLAKDTASGNNTLMCVTGGDAISIERKGQDAFSYRFKGFMCVCSNQMPKTRGNLTQAYYNRLLICQCPNAVPFKKRDKKLLEKILTEKDAIVSICLDAYKATITDERNYSFTVPKDNEDFIKELKAENDSTAEFFTDYCKLYESKQIDGEPYTRPGFYEVYTGWFKRNYPHRTSPSCKEFYKNLRDFFNLQDDCRKSHGVRFSLVTLTLEAKNELRQGTQEINGNSDVLDGIAGYAES